MMLEVVSLVRQLLPGLLQSGRQSVACIQTTRPKYLVFDNDPFRPVCVVEFGPADRLLRVHKILSELHSRMPGLVPRSLCCVPCQNHIYHQNDIYVYIQEGLRGMPWFRLADKLKTVSDWQRLLTRVVATMNEMHAAVRGIPSWVGSVNVRTELFAQVGRLELAGLSLSPLALQRINEWAEGFGMDVGPCIWQHGDFSINNLLVSDNSIAVIDFDEFGSTLVPLHDAFGLALSLHLFHAGQCPLSRNECIRACLDRSLTHSAILVKNVAGLLMHHLLFRINQCHGLERRSVLCRSLLIWVEDLARDPEVFLGNLGCDAVS